MKTQILDPQNLEKVQPVKTRKIDPSGCLQRFEATSAFMGICVFHRICGELSHPKPTAPPAATLKRSIAMNKSRISPEKLTNY
jgi:hypothetical protein